MKTQLLEAVIRHPQSIRELFRKPEVRKALESLGILTTMFELHAPSPSGRSSRGLGPTLCNYRGRRHPRLVTCRKCLAKLERNKN
jgi:hypothetical protein